MAIITCDCGARVRLPDGAEGKAFRCPRCKADILIPVEAIVLSTSPAGGAGKEGECPICQSKIEPAEVAVSCPECEQVHHRDCWNEIGGCSTYGCKKVPALEKEVAGANRTLTAWGDTKKCPACGETIKSIALRCRFCGTDFDTVDPLKVADLRKGARKAKNLKKTQTTATVLFILSIIGCLAPLILVLGFALLWPKRDLLSKGGPFYLVLSYSAIIISVVYSILMVLFFIISNI